MAGLEYRGPFLLLFAVNQQLDTLLTRAMADAPLRPSEFAVYSVLRLVQPTTPSELAATLGLRATTMSSQLVKMADAGHLERIRNPRDGRSRLISLTPAGVAATEGCFPAFGQAIRSFQEHLTLPERALLEALEAASTALTAATDEIGSADPGSQSPDEPEA